MCQGPRSALALTQHAQKPEPSAAWHMLARSIPGGTASLCPAEHVWLHFRLCAWTLGTMQAQARETSRHHAGTMQRAQASTANAGARSALEWSASSASAALLSAASGSEVLTKNGRTIIAHTQSCCTLQCKDWIWGGETLVSVRGRARVVHQRGQRGDVVGHVGGLARAAQQVRCDLGVAQLAQVVQRAVLERAPRRACAETGRRMCVVQRKDNLHKACCSACLQWPGSPT